MNFKIVVIGPTPPPYYGVAIATERILHSYLQKEFQILHLDTSDRRENLNFGNFDIGNISYAIKHILKLFWLILFQRPNLVYLPISQSGWGFFRDALFIWISSVGRAKIILHLRGAYFRNFYESSNPLMKRMIRSSLKRVDRLIVLCKGIQNIFEGLILPEKLRVVPNGVNVIEDIPVRNSGGKNKPVQLCFISNLERTKGYFEVLKALTILAKKYNLICRFAGAWWKDSDREEVTDYIKKNLLQGRAQFIGTVKGKEKKKLLMSSDIFVFPTYFKYEGQPWVVLEAMAAGLPVITTDHACNRETVIDNETGYLIPKQDVDRLVEKIERLVVNPGLRISMGKKGQQRIKTHLSEKNFIHRLGSVFHEFQHL